jgi:hypothetical protein
MVYRGIALTPKKRQALIDLVERAKTNGQLVQFPGFSSTSIDPNVAAGDEFTTQKKPTVLEIRATHGAPAGSLGRKFEAEILLDHNSTFRVVGVETVKYRQDDGRMIPVTAIQLEQVPTPAKPKVVERLSAGGTAIVKAVKDSVNRFVLDSVEGIALVTP